MFTSPRLTPTDSPDRHYAALVDALCGLSEAYHYAGRMGDAVRVVQRGLEMVNEKEINPRDLLRLLLQQGRLLTENHILQAIEGSYEDTFAVLQRAYQIAETANDSAAVATALDLMGEMYHYERLFHQPENSAERPLDYFNRALAIWQTLDDSRGKCWTLFHVGLIYQVTGRAAEAEPTYQQALDLANAGGFWLEKSYVVRHIGFIANNRDDTATALALLTESVALREQVGYRIALPFAILALGDLASKMKDLALAETHYQKARQLATEMNLQAPLAFALMSLGELCVQRKQFSEARPPVEQAIELARSIGNQRAVNLASQILSEIEQQAG